MKIRIDGYESPHILRALATLFTTLADEPQYEKDCAEPCGKPVNDVPGRATAYEPDYSVLGGYVLPAPTGLIVPPPPSGYEVVGQVHDETLVAPTGLVVPPPPPAPQIAVTAPTAGALSAAASSAATSALVTATDKTGTPWDARIHSSSRALVANGTWRLKKGVDKALVESVARELREPERAAVSLVPQPPSTVNPAPHAAASTAQATYTGVAGIVPPPPAMPIAAQPVAMPFNEISRYFAVNSMAGKLTHADMEAMAKHSGVTYTQDLMTAAHASKRPAALAYLQQLVESRTPVHA